MIDEAFVEQVKNLKPADRLELIEVIWDSLSPTDLLITNDDRALLDARIADMNPIRVIGVAGTM